MQSQMSEKLVSIIIPTFNRAALLGETLNSVYTQTYRHWECIVVDDGSNDESEKLFEYFRSLDSRFSFIANNRSKGAPGARNTGVEVSKGELLVFLDSDDLLDSRCLANRVKKFQDFPAADFLVFNTLQFTHKPGDSDILINIPKGLDDLSRFFNLDVPWLIMAPIWKKTSFLKNGYWNENILSWQDWEYHVRAILGGLIYHCFETVDNYCRRNFALETIGSNSLSRNHLKSHLGLIKQIKSQVRQTAYLQQLNGLAYWVSLQALKNNNKDIAKIAIQIAFNNKPFEQQLNKLFIKIFGKIIFPYPIIPDFGSMGKLNLKITQGGSYIHS
jgi:glycosyltransferase involved in cell wall biosynthesis